MRFETLVCHLLEAMDYQVLHPPAIGPDGGRDILVERILRDAMPEVCQKVVVQCKHYARSGRKVGDRDVGVWQTTMTRYRAQGYLLVTDTYVTEKLSTAFREYTAANSPTKWATFWDVDRMIRHLHEHPKVRDSFLEWASPTPSLLEEQAAEVQAWLGAMGYRVDNVSQLDERTVAMETSKVRPADEERTLVHYVGGRMESTDIAGLATRLGPAFAQGWLISFGCVPKEVRDQASAYARTRVFSLIDYAMASDVMRLLLEHP